MNLTLKKHTNEGNRAASFVFKWWQLLRVLRSSRARDPCGPCSWGLSFSDVPRVRASQRTHRPRRDRCSAAGPAGAQNQFSSWEHALEALPAPQPRPTQGRSASPAFLRRVPGLCPAPAGWAAGSFKGTPSRNSSGPAASLPPARAKPAQRRFRAQFQQRERSQRGGGRGGLTRVPSSSPG